MSLLSQIMKVVDDAKTDEERKDLEKVLYHYMRFLAGRKPKK